MRFAHMREETAIAEGNTGVLCIPAQFLQVQACFASNCHPDTYPLMPIIGIISISAVITVINFTVSSNVSLSSVDHGCCLPSSSIRSMKSNVPMLSLEAPNLRLASGLAWPITMGWWQSPLENAQPQKAPGPAPVVCRAPDRRPVPRSMGRAGGQKPRGRWR